MADDALAPRVARASADILVRASYPQVFVSKEENCQCPLRLDRKFRYIFMSRLENTAPKGLMRKRGNSTAHAPELHLIGIYLSISQVWFNHIALALTKPNDRNLHTSIHITLKQVLQYEMPRMITYNDDLHQPHEWPSHYTSNPPWNDLDLGTLPWPLEWPWLWFMSNMTFKSLMTMTFIWNKHLELVSGVLSPFFMKFKWKTTKFLSKGNSNMEEMQTLTRTVYIILKKASKFIMNRIL